MAKLPAFQFYPGDWLKDPSVRRLSKSAKGFLIDAICVLHENEDRGVFATGSDVWSRDEIAHVVGGDAAENLQLLDEVLQKGALKRNSQGAVFSRRMIKDEEIRRIRSKVGSKGGSKTQAKLKQTGKQIPEDEDEENKEKESAERKGKPAITSDDIFKAYPRQVGQDVALIRIRRAMSMEDPVLLLERTKAYAAAVAKWPPGNMQYVPHPKNWYDEGRWKDDPATWAWTGDRQPSGRAPQRRSESPPLATN